MTQSFEEQPASCQLLTFENIGSYLKRTHGNERSEPRGMRDDEGRFTNFAYMLSDQNPWHVEFRHDGQTETINGSIIQLIDSSMAAITLQNPPVEMKNRTGMYRRFPSIAVKEAVVNAMIHSDFSAGESIMITIQDDYISICSPGGMFLPKEWKDVSLTNPRNWRLSGLLMEFRYVTLKGNGMTVMKNCYTGSGLVPCIIQGTDDFTVRLPALDNPVREKDHGASMVSEYLDRKHGAFIPDISHDLMISVHYAKKIVDELESKGEVFTLGIGSKRRAYPIKRAEKTEMRIR